MWCILFGELNYVDLQIRDVVECKGVLNKQGDDDGDRVEGCEGQYKEDGGQVIENDVQC